MPLDLPASAPVVPLATKEAQEAYLEAAFSSRHPVLIADAVNVVARAREAAGIPSDEAWESTFELFHSATNAQHILEAAAEAEAYRAAAGLDAIDGPSTGE
jgi:PHD/YefM family antitoxin component YafN of YafNO toxin-antitoxin module